LRVDDELSTWVDRYLQGVDNATALKNLSRQDVRVLREAFQQDEIRKVFGVLWNIPQTEILLEILRQLQEGAGESAGISCEGQETQELLLRSVWEYGRARCASQGWRDSEQHRREHSDALPFLPHEIALELVEAWHCVTFTQEAISGRRVAR
jgi:hypothetical protein